MRFLTRVAGPIEVMSVDVECGLHPGDRPFDIDVSAGGLLEFLAPEVWTAEPTVIALPSRG